MTRFALALLVLATTRAAIAAPSPNTALVDQAKAAPIVFVGKLVDVGPAPLYLSGVLAAFQTLTYQVVAPLKGTIKTKKVEVRYLIAGGEALVGYDPGSNLPLVAKNLRTVGELYVLVEADDGLGLRAIDAAVYEPVDVAAIRKL